MEDMTHIKTIHSTVDVREYYLKGHDNIVEKVHRSNNKTSVYHSKVRDFIKKNPNHEILPILSAKW